MFFSPFQTPAVPKHVRKTDGKVSTPRQEDGGRAPEVALSTKDLVRTCFGFDESSESEGETDSLVGFSPVSGSNKADNRNITAQVRRGKDLKVEHGVT